MPIGIYPRPSLRERFEAKYIPEPNSGCWLWIAGCSDTGYGSFRFRGRAENAHRLAYQMYVGEIPDGLYVLHKCDIRCCVNPAHLFLGTDLDNIADMHAKGRSNGGSSPGERHPMVKLTNADVMAIREDTRTGLAIARHYGVSPTTVSSIKLRHSWKHLT